MSLVKHGVNYKCVHHSFLAEELAVKQKYEKVDVYLSSVKHFHDSDSFILQLQKVLHHIKP